MHNVICVTLRSEWFEQDATDTQGSHGNCRTYSLMQLSDTARYSEVCELHILANVAVHQQGKMQLKCGIYGCSGLLDSA